MDAKTQDCEPVNPLFTSKILQTLCETQSGVSLVQGTPDFDKSAFRLINRQGKTYWRRKEQPRPPIYCAKSECYLVLLGRSGLFAKVDAESLPVISKYPWHTHSFNVKNKTLYAATRLGGRFQTMHRMLCGLKPHGDGLVDHINGDPLDNRICNLRVATPLGNAQNRKARDGQFKGIHNVNNNRNKPRNLKKPWLATIGSDRRFLGLYATAEEAARAYDAAAIKLYGPYARLNFQSHSPALPHPHSVTPQ